MKAFRLLLPAVIALVVALGAQPAGAYGDPGPASPATKAPPGPLARVASHEESANSAHARSHATVRGGLVTSDEIETVLEELYTAVSPSVVHIWGRVWMQEDTSGAPDPSAAQNPGTGGLSPEWSLGSGFVWDADGHIVTNNHVVDGAEGIHVTFTDGRTVSASIVGQDALTDLAVLKVEAEGLALKPVTMGDSTEVAVGQFAVAIGNPFGFESTMTFGIVSAIGRVLPVVRENAPIGGPPEIIPDVIQTDAPINPGNSGGVLADLNGQVIGVTSDGGGGVDWSTGVAFAIASVVVQRVVPALIEEGAYQPPWLGANTLTLFPEFAAAMGLPETQQGALVIDINAGSPADAAGLHGSSTRATIDGEDWLVGGDVIVNIDGQPVRRAEDVDTYLVRNTQVGDEVELSVIREGEEMRLTIEVGTPPQPEAASSEEQVIEEAPPRAWLGVEAITLTPELAKAMKLRSAKKGVLVQSVVAGSPADEAGLRGGYKRYESEDGSVTLGGDVITAADGEPVTSIEELVALVGVHSSGDELVLTLLRQGKEIEVTVTLAAPPEATM